MTVVTVTDHATLVRQIIEDSRNTATHLRAEADKRTLSAAAASLRLYVDAAQVSHVHVPVTYDGGSAYLIPSDDDDNPAADLIDGLAYADLPDGMVTLDPGDFVVVDVAAVRARITPAGHVIPVPPAADGAPATDGDDDPAVTAEVDRIGAEHRQATGCTGAPADANGVCTVCGADLLGVSDDDEDDPGIVSERQTRAARGTERWV